MLRDQLQALLAEALESPIDDDSAVRRLLPDAYRHEPELADEWRRLSRRGLVDRKIGFARTLSRALAPVANDDLSHSVSISTDAALDWVRAQMPRAFNTLVDPKLEVRRLPLVEEPGAPGAYGGAGSKDGSIPSFAILALLSMQKMLKVYLLLLMAGQASWNLSYPALVGVIPIEVSLTQVRASLTLHQY